MQTDIVLEDEDKILIIDAKYYQNSLQRHFNVEKLHSGNLYQIFTYVKNMDTGLKKVSGMLLYARTDEEVYPCFTYKMSANSISTRTLDLSKDFSLIKKELDSIVEDFF